MSLNDTADLPAEMTLQIPDGIAALAYDMTIWRRHLHAHPETAFEEVETARFIADKLRAFGGIKVHEGLAGTGVIGVLDSGTPGPSVGLRADIDALDIVEQTNLPWSSRTPGKMHACGHDGHTTMLLGAAKHLATRGGFAGRVVFIFQPAEENEGGAKVMLDQGLFDLFPVDAVFALHNRPGLAVGQFAISPGPVMAGYDLFHITVTGKGGHAAKPHLAVDPILISAHILVGLQSVVSRMADPIAPVVLSCTQISAGEAINAIPGEVRIAGTVRCFDPAVQAMAETAIRRIVSMTAGAHGGHASVDYEHRYPALVNDPASADLARNAAAPVFGAAGVQAMPQGTGSEDFAFMLQQRPGAYGLLGTGDGPSVHNPAYDFNDDVLTHGAAWWTSLVDMFFTRAG
ncbi:M20 family metallopeptidase [Rhodobacteraceae bacterium LMO-12]|nr:M20 family metallopeptidase [Rhodobacteraceae bacterium LMO-JJ12]